LKEQIFFESNGGADIIYYKRIILKLMLKIASENSGEE
jgi:hypothetical protein